MIKKYLVCRFSASIFIIAVTVVTLCSATLTPRQMRDKAQRFYDHEEWPNALAMYHLILQDDSTDLQAYGRVIAIYSLLERDDNLPPLFEQSQQCRVAIDSLLSEVKTSAFEIGHPQAYERFLLVLKESEPWMRRNINLHLARYYDSRNSAEKMVEIADTLLAVNPSDPESLHIKARGKMLLSDYISAIDIYKHIVTLSPDDVDAMLNVGVYYLSEVEHRGLELSSHEAVEARRYLNMAYAVKPTAHLRALLQRLAL